MAEKYSLGLKSVKFGEPTGTVAMPVAMNPFAKTVKGSMTITENEPTIKEFKVEEVDAPVRRAITESGSFEAKWRAFDLSPATLELVKGGTATATKFSAPSKSVIVELALELETDDGVIITVPKGSVTARIDGQVGRDDMIQLEVTVVAIDPGDGGSPWQIEQPA